MGVSLLSPPKKHDRAQGIVPEKDEQFASGPVKKNGRLQAPIWSTQPISAGGGA
jgi:hypothetical protein